jgi:hypothetical protein
MVHSQNVPENLTAYQTTNTMMRKELMAAYVAAALISAVIAVSWFSTSLAQTDTGGDSMSDEDHEESMESTVVRDSLFIRGPIKLAPQDYLHLYDSTPYMIMNGHVAVRMACDANAEPSLQILVGQAPDLKPAELEYIEELSQPGQLCIYHVDLASEHGEDVEGGIITDIALFNPSDTTVRLPWQGGSVVIGVNEIMPLEGDHHGEEEEEHEEESESTGNMTG